MFNCLVHWKRRYALPHHRVQYTQALSHANPSPHRPFKVKAAAMSVFFLPAFHHQVQPFVCQTIVRFAMKTGACDDGPKCQQQTQLGWLNAVKNIA